MSNEVAIYLADAPKYFLHTKPEVYGTRGAGPLSWALREAHKDKSLGFRILWWIVCYLDVDRTRDIFQRHHQQSILDRLRRDELRAVAVDASTNADQERTAVGHGDWYGHANWETSELRGQRRDYRGVQIVVERDDAALGRSRVHFEEFKDDEEQDESSIIRIKNVNHIKKRGRGRPSDEIAIMQAIRKLPVDLNAIVADQIPAVRKIALEMS